jgi:prepilin signal peptidase PulO-like enzyme (type II secretory pathway)
MKIENIKKIKSTILGLALIVFASLLIYNSITFDYYILGSLYFFGIMFLFSGDAWINKLEEIIFSYIKNKLK